MAYKPGDYYAICDICGMRGYASEMRMTWNKLFVHSLTCFDEKHPHFTDPKPLNEPQRVPIHRPEQEDVFITTPITGDDL